jgi:hypothetical protein
MNDLEKLIALSKVVAKPWVIATWVLAGLLALSVAGNIYLSLKEIPVLIDSDSYFSNSDNNISSVKGK